MENNGKGLTFAAETMETKGILYLIPAPLGDNDPREVIPAAVLERLCVLEHFVVEELRTARRYLSRAGLKGKIEGLHLYELNEHTPPEAAERYVELLRTGRDVGLISEAGLPAVADPGARLVELAHRNGIRVCPMSGPSSLMMALMSSGMNGQCFAFTGYLPVKPEERKARIREIEKISAGTGQSQIIIETPYRNDSLLADLLSVCATGTRICIAADITQPGEYIVTRTAGEWRRERPGIGKRPCVFVLQAARK